MTPWPVIPFATFDREGGKAVIYDRNLWMDIGCDVAWRLHFFLRFPKSYPPLTWISNKIVCWAHVRLILQIRLTLLNINGTHRAHPLPLAISRLWDRRNHTLWLCPHCWVHQPSTELQAHNHTDSHGWSQWVRPKLNSYNVWEKTRSKVLTRVIERCGVSMAGECISKSNLSNKNKEIVPSFTFALATLHMNLGWKHRGNTDW